MARQADIDKWFESFKNMLSTSEISLNLNDKNDVERIQVASGDKTESLFSDGFEDTPENREKLYDNAKEGRLFAFSKKDNKAFQMAANQSRDCTVRDAEKTEMPPQKPEDPGILRHLLNILTLGLYGTRWSETMKKYDRQKKEYKRDLKAFEKRNGIRRVSSVTKGLNWLSRGLLFHNRCLDHKRGYQQLTQNRNLRGVLSKASQTWANRSEEERKNNISEKQKEKVDEQLKELNEVKKENAKVENAKVENAQVENAQVENTQKESVQAENVEKDANVSVAQGGGEAWEHPLTKMVTVNSQFNQLYEDMKDALAKPGGWKEYAGKVQDMGKIMQEIDNNPDLKEAFKGEKAIKGENRYEEMKRMYQSGNRMLEIHEKGLKAKSALMDWENNTSLSQDQKKEYIKDALKANMLENSLVTDALVRRKMRAIGASQKKIRKAGNTMDSMVRNPKEFEEKWDNLVRDLPVNQKMQNESGRVLAWSAANKMNLSAWNDAKDMMRKQKQERDAQREKAAKGPNMERQNSFSIKSGPGMQVTKAESMEFGPKNEPKAENVKKGPELNLQKESQFSMQKAEEMNMGGLGV